MLNGNETFYTNASVRLKTYSSLTHFFMTRTSAPANAKNLITGHVAEEVIDDVASGMTDEHRAVRYHAT